jgi:multiple sugar transport system permease protein
LVFALIIAMLFNVKRRAVGFYRTLYYIPSIMGGSVAIAIMWKQIFSAKGALNSILGLMGIECNISWVSAPGTAIWTLILLAIWQFGSPMLIFLAGLKQIPQTCYEAAEIDGANSWQRFTRITFPLLSPVIFFNLVMQTISGFMVFTQGVIITDGGRPLDTTLFYAVYLYQKAFTTFQMGYGSAMAWVLLIVIAFFTALIFKSSSAWVFYESKGDM